MLDHATFISINQPSRTFHNGITIVTYLLEDSNVKLQLVNRLHYSRSVKLQLVCVLKLQ